MSDLTDGYIHVEYSGVNNAIDDMVLQTKAIATTLSNLEAELGQLRKTWFGEDAQTYEGKQAAWDNAVLAMERMLTSNASLLDTIGGNYKYSEASLSAMWADVTIGR
nr:WXG100 family type VII secretion target [Streptomyces sp. NBC_00974]